MLPPPMTTTLARVVPYKMKKALRETQTLRADCSKAEPKNFALPQTPFTGAQDGQNLISWKRSLPSPTDQVWWKSMHAISSYHGNRHCPSSALPPHTGPITIHCAAMLSALCNRVHLIQARRNKCRRNRSSHGIIKGWTDLSKTADMIEARLR